MALTSLVDVIERIFSSNGKFCIQETLIVTHPQLAAMLRYYNLYWVLSYFDTE